MKTIEKNKHGRKGRENKSQLVDDNNVSIKVQANIDKQSNRLTN